MGAINIFDYLMVSYKVKIFVFNILFMVVRDKQINQLREQRDRAEKELKEEKVSSTINHAKTHIKELKEEKVISTINQSKTHSTELKEEKVSSTINQS